MTTAAAGALAAVCLMFAGAGPQGGETEFQAARAALTGEHKNTEQARKLLLQIVAGPTPAVSAETLSYAYVYLGYIEDRDKNRAAAIEWYKKALAVQGGSPGILAVAKSGLARPITWIRHLDTNEPAPGVAAVPRPPAAPKMATGYLTSEQPPKFTLARNLSPADRLKNFEELWNSIDRTYAGFKLKSIDWDEVKQRYMRRLAVIGSDDEFYLLMFQLVNELKDTHSWLQNYRVTLWNVPALSVDLFEGKPYVVAVGPGTGAARAGVAPGWEVLSVDGMSVAEKMEALRPYLNACSSERAYRREAARQLLAGARDGAAAVELRSPDGRTEKLTLRRELGATNRVPARTAPFPVTRGRFVAFGKHPSGPGYIRLQSFNGRDEVLSEFEHALDALWDAPGLILDVRDNVGGYGQVQIIKDLLEKPKRVGYTYMKSGPRRGRLTRSEVSIAPSGVATYSHPIAVLINGVTASAAELFASELHSAGRVTTVGTTTHGALSGFAMYAVLPCGLVARISNGYAADAKDRPIEGNGTAPDVVVEPTIEDFLNGRDPALDRAAAVLVERTGSKERR